MEKRHRRLNSELNEELIQRRVKMEDFETHLDEIIKKAEEKLNTFSSPEKENRETQTPENVKRKLISGRESRLVGWFSHRFLIEIVGYDRRKLDKALSPSNPNHLLAASGLLEDYEEVGIETADAEDDEDCGDEEYWTVILFNKIIYSPESGFLVKSLKSEA